MQHPAPYSRLAVTVFTVLMILSAANTVCGDQVVNLLPNGGAERIDSASEFPADWSMASLPATGLTMWRDIETRFRGQASFAIANEYQYEQLVTNNWMHELQYVPRGRMIRVCGFIQTNDAKAANICVQCWGSTGQLIGFASTPVLRGSKEWTWVESERIVVPKETTKLMVRAALTGQGAAWFDDIRLEIVEPPVVSDPGLASALPGRIMLRLPVVKDAMVLAYLPQWNHGNVDNVAVASNDGGVRTLLAWQLPSAADMSAAQYKFLLALYCREARGPTETARLSIHEIAADWPEIVSWNEMPDTADEPAIETGLHRSVGWKFIDVTPLIRGTARDVPPHGVMLRMESEDCNLEKSAEDRNYRCSDFRFVSREGIGEWENRRPLLLVVDPDQPPLDEPVTAPPPTIEAPVLTTQEFLQYIEYLAALPESTVRQMPGAKEAELAAQRAAYKAMEQRSPQGTRTPQQQWIASSLTSIPPYEQFAATYPLTPEGMATMSGILTKLYLDAEQPAAAKRLATAASHLARGSEGQYLAEINRAWVQQQCGEVEAAEARLRRVTKAELPATRDRRWSDILWVAPSNLGDLLYASKKYAEAEAVYVQLIGAVAKWVSEHPEDREVAVSYALSAQRGRINIELDADLDNDAAVERLIDEFEHRFPGYTAPPMGSPGALLRENVNIRRQLRDEQESAKQDPAED